MILKFSKDFKKRYQKFDPAIQKQVGLRLKLFATDQTHPQLNIHKLKGPYKNFYSMNISGDIRALYEILDTNAILFIKLGTHSELYK